MVVFAVGFHVPGMCRVIQSGVVRVAGVREHSMGFFRVATARSGVLGTHEGVFPGGGIRACRSLNPLPAARHGDVAGGGQSADDGADGVLDPIPPTSRCCLQGLFYVLFIDVHVICCW